MFISKTKTKNTTTYYLVKSFKNPDTGKVSTKTVERIGNTQEIKAKIGNKDIETWLNDYAKKKTLETNDKNNPKITLSLNKSKKINRHNNVKNAGYLYIKKACSDLGLKRICNKITNEEHIKYDLYKVATHLIYNIIFDSTESRHTSLYQLELIEEGNLKEEDVIDSLRVLSKYGIEIQKMLYKYLKKNLSIDNTKLFYSCTNYSDINYQIYKSSDIDFPEEIITHTKVFFDSNGFPCMLIADNNVNRKYNQYEAVQKFLKSNFDKANLYVLPDSIYSATDSILLQQFDNTSKISNQKVSNFNQKLLAWATDPAGWHRNNSNNIFDIEKVEQKITDIKTPLSVKTKLRSQIFYKYKKVKISIPGTNKSLPQYMIVMFNYALKLWLKNLRDNQFDNFNDEDEAVVSNYKEALKRSEAYDGYYAVCINSDTDIINDMLNVLSTKFDQVDFMLRFIKNEFITGNQLSQEEAINAHYLTTFISLTIFKYITQKLRNRFTNEEVVEALKSITFVRLGSEGWIPTFVPSVITDSLYEVFNIDFDHEFIPNKDMKKLLKI